MPRTPAAALVAVLLLASCARPASPDAARPRPQHDVAADVHGAALAAAEAGSGRFRVTLRIEATDGTADPVVVDIKTTGAFDGRRRELQSDFGAAVAALEGDDAGLPPGFDEPVQVVVDGTTTYLRAPMLDELVGASQWLMADRQADTAAEELGPLGLTTIGGGIGAVDPVPVLEALQHAERVDDVGTDEVDGVPVRRLRAELDLSRALHGLGAALAVPVELSVDDAGRVVRLVADLGDAADVLGSGPDATSAPDMAGSVTMTVELYDYGADLEVAMPDPDDVLPVEVALGTARDAIGRAGAGKR